MTYLEFLLIFIIPLVIMGMIYFKKSLYKDKHLVREAIMFLIFLAVTYTTPWDNYLVKTGVWSYEDKNILFRIGYVPFEEYCFFILQTILTSCWSLWILKRFHLEKSSTTSLNKHAVTVFLSLVIIASLFWLQQEQTRYLGLILVWAAPVILLQWLVGGQHLLKNLKIFLLCLMPPTVYLWIVDGFAIYKNIWTISALQTIGVNFYSLPLEEALFFLSTNIMLCQGLLLYLMMKNDFVNKWKRS